MAYVLTLAFHLTAAAVTGVIILFILIAIVRGRVELYRTSALALGFVAAFEVVSGTVLSFVSPTTSVASLSLHIVFYLGVCVLAEALLFVIMRKISFTFPIDAVASPVLASVIIFILVAQSSI